MTKKINKKKVNRIGKKDFLIVLMLSLTALFSRLPLIEKFQSHWDGPDYSIAVIRYSLAEHTPTPPGYPLYIAMGKFFHIFFDDPYKSMLFVSVFGSVIGSIALFLIGKKLYSRTAGLVATSIFLTGSPFYFFSLTPYAYGLIPVMTIILGFVVYNIYLKNKQYGLFLGLVTGIYFGLRPQEMLQVGLLPIFGFLLLDRRQKVNFLMTFTSITLLWFLPLVHDSGGINKYLSLNFLAAEKGVFLFSTLTHNLGLMTKGFLLSFGFSSIFLLYYPIKIIKNKKVAHGDIKTIFFYLIWIMPSILFNVFLRTDHAGYQMSYIAGFIILISYAAWKTTRKSKILTLLTIASIVVFNLYWFFYNRDPNYTKTFRPTSFHYSDIRKNDLKVGSKVNYVGNNFNSSKTLLIATDALWRQYSYYLKSFKIIGISALNNTDLPYAYQNYEGYNWNIKGTSSKKFELKIPNNFEQIVFMDDEAKGWIKNYPYKKINLPGNSSLTIINVKPNSSLIYNYHEIRLK